MRSVGSLMALSVLTIVWGISGVQAAGLAGGSQALSTAALSTAVEKIHGCHSHYARGLQGWHRHGSDCTLRRDLADSKRRKKI
jgi:hypothetical protein